MLITFSQGKIIANHRELMVKLEGRAKVTLQAQVDDVELIGSANVVTALASGVNWSTRLDNSEQLEALSTAIGIAIKYR
ncbi:MAG: hypothetical protein ACJAT7_002065 [Psychromonas sp.]|jgi:hypothetical protein|uniref:DUF3389 domain-containing protein n=1 Tax=Psychromonas sp. TaxID=1884585 RepID=UPI0039E46E6C